MRSATIILTSEDGKRAIAVDDEVYNEILAYVGSDNRHANKFKDITNIILSGLTNRNLYDKEVIDTKSKGVRAMKLFKGQENDRIYCKEMTMGNQTFVVIAAALHLRKKTTKLSHKERNTIHKVANYEYREIKSS